MQHKMSEKSYFGLGKVPIGIGAILHGWDITEEEFRSGVSVVDFRTMTHNCPRDCFHCFTNKNKRTLTLNQIKRAINEVADMGAKSIDFLGEGEPTIDPEFFDIIDYTASRNVVPIIFTEAATRMRDREFVKRIYDIGASVCPKCDSLIDAEYQNWVVCDKTGKYFDLRNEALNILIEEGFNKVESDGTTRLGFDMVVTNRNIFEVPATLRYCRKNNLRIMFSTFLPSGRSAEEGFYDKHGDLVVKPEQLQFMRNVVKYIDKEMFNFDHPIWNNFATTPCVERMQIYGDGRVSPCSGNENIVGFVQNEPLKVIHHRLIEQFPQFNPSCFNGSCVCRPQI